MFNYTFLRSNRKFLPCKNSLLKLNIKNLNRYNIAKIHHQLSIINFKQQRYSEAIVEISKTISYDENYIEAYKYRAMLKEEMNDLLGALDDLNLALKKKPGNKYLLNE
jgi:Tfp pilus assembly protein PilF